MVNIGVRAQAAPFSGSPSNRTGEEAKKAIICIPPPPLRLRDVLPREPKPNPSLKPYRCIHYNCIELPWVASVEGPRPCQPRRIRHVYAYITMGGVFTKCAGRAENRDGHGWAVQDTMGAGMGANTQAGGLRVASIRFCNSVCEGGRRIEKDCSRFLPEHDEHA